MHILTDVIKFEGMSCTCSNGKVYKLHSFCYFSTPVWCNFTIEDNGEYIQVVLARRVNGLPDDDDIPSYLLKLCCEV